MMMLCILLRRYVINGMLEGDGGMTMDMHHEHHEVFCPDCWAWDPMAKLRVPTDPPLDVITTGTVFFDIIFTGLPGSPSRAKNSGAPAWGPVPVA